MSPSPTTGDSLRWSVSRIPFSQTLYPPQWTVLKTDFRPLYSAENTKGKVESRNQFTSCEQNVSRWFELRATCSELVKIDSMTSGLFWVYPDFLTSKKPRIKILKSVWLISKGLFPLFSFLLLLLLFCHSCQQSKGYLPLQTGQYLRTFVLFIRDRWCDILRLFYFFEKLCYHESWISTLRNRDSLFLSRKRWESQSCRVQKKGLSPRKSKVLA